MTKKSQNRHALPSVATAVFAAALSAGHAQAQGAPPPQDPRAPDALWGATAPSFERLRVDETNLKLVLPDTPEHAIYVGGVKGVPGPNGEVMTIDKKGITLYFPEADFKWNIGGRLHLDYGASGLSRPGLPEPFFSNIGVRRAWLENDFSIGKDWGVRFWYDFAPASPTIQDAFIAYRGFENTRITLGNQKFPYTMEWLLPNNFQMFESRSLIQGFVPNPAREFGLTVGHAGKENWTVLGGVFGGSALGTARDEGITSNGVAGVFRGTWAPILTDTEVLHFGVTANTRYRTREEGDFRISRFDDAFLFRQSFADTGNIPNVSTVTRTGAEFAYRNGPLLVKAEYANVNLGRFAGGGPSLNFQGGYIAASYVLNSQNRPYDLVPSFGGPSFAVFGNVPMNENQRISRGGIGVWEVAARFDIIDLNDRDRFGGRDRNVTLGINWYPEPNIKIYSDYIHGRINPGAFQLAATGTRALSDNTFIGRLQLYW